MTWFKVDDGICEHAKLDLIERRHGARMLADCMLVWLGIGTWCARQLAQGNALPDGVIDATALRRLRRGETDPEQCARVLVAVGLLDEVEEGFAMHDWHEYQPTSEEVATKREANRERQRRHRMAKLAADKKASGNGVTSPKSRRDKSQRDERRDERHAAGHSVTSGSETTESRRYIGPSRRDKGRGNGVSHAPPDPDPGVSLKGDTPEHQDSSRHDVTGRGTPREDAGAPPLRSTKVEVVHLPSGFTARITAAEWAADQAKPRDEQLYMRAGAR